MIHASLDSRVPGIPELYGSLLPPLLQIAIDVSKEEAGSLADIQFVLFQDELLNVWRQEAEAARLERIQEDEKGEGAHRRKQEL